MKKWIENPLLTIAIFLSISFFVSACVSAPAQESPQISLTPVPTDSSTPEPSASPDPSPVVTDPLYEFMRIQLNLSIDELYEQFPRKIIATYQSGEYTVDIERIYRNYSYESGGVYPQFSFDKPIVSGEGEGIKKLNIMFDNDACGFFYGHEDAPRFKFGKYDFFYVVMYNGEPVMEETSSENGEDLIGRLRVCILKATVTYLDESILSMREDYYWQAGMGHLYISPYGMTFDLNTGELLPLSYFVGDDLASFKQHVIDMLYESIDESNPFRTIREIKRFSEKQENYEFSDYGYYYDGAHIFLILPELDWYDLPYVLQLPGTYSAGC